ncbi:MAG: hypothetical protein Q7S04_01605 [Candidatus Moranbacteria bacterium]|nr:hypothetical protein [Candidatus Moranbacteria bacterium]
MKKIFQKKKIWFVVLFFSGVAIISWNSVLHQALRGETFVAVAHAEDDEDEYEDENENDDNYSSDTQSPVTSSSTKTTKVKSVPTYKTVLVTKVVTTLDPQFTTDRDGDRIVDGLDPHPSVHEREYFTDVDDDGIADAFDEHSGEDDFAYYEQENDENQNGILDSYELMASR